MKHDRQVGIRGAAAIQFGSKYASMGVQLLITAVLSRIISPADYGILAIVTVFITFFAMFSDMGIGVAIIQFRELRQEDFGALFFLSLLMAACLAALFCACSPLIAAFYGDGQLVPLCCVASLSLFFGTLNLVPNGLLLREKRFGAIGLRLIVATVVTGAIGIALALLGWGVYALVLQSVASSLFVLLWNLAARPVRGINVHFVAPLKTIFSYSAFQFGFNLVNYFSRNMDNLLIGKFVGSAALGYYDKAYKLTTYPLTSISGVVGSVLQPYLAEHQDDLDLIYEKWAEIAKMLSLVAAVCAALLVGCADEVVLIVYGDQWGPAVAILRFLGVSVYCQMTFNPNGAIFQSANHTDYMFKHSIVSTALTMLGIIPGLAAGSIELVAMGVAAAYCLHPASIMYFLNWRVFHRNPLRFIANLLPEVLIGAAAAVACLAIGGSLSLDAAPMLAVKLAAAGAVFAAGYGATGQYRHLKRLIGRRPTRPGEGAEDE